MTSPTKSRKGSSTGRSRRGSARSSSAPGHRPQSRKRHSLSPVRRHHSSRSPSKGTISDQEQSLANMTLGGSMTARQLHPEGQGQVTEENTMEFTRKVKRTFKDKPSVYKRFVKIMSEVRCADTDKVDVVNKVIALFDGYPELVKEFNKFLPANCRIELRGDVALIKIYEETQNEFMLCPGSTMTDTYVTTGAGRPGTVCTLGGTATSSDFGDDSFLGSTRDSMGNVYLAGATRSYAGEGTTRPNTVQYVKRVKKAYEKKPKTYRKFIQVLKAYHKEQENELCTIRAIVDLFQNRTDLVLGFNDFLPDGYKIRMFDKRGYVIEHPAVSEGDASDITHMMIDEKFV